MQKTKITDCVNLLYYTVCVYTTVLSFRSFYTAILHSKNAYVRNLTSKGHAAIGSYVMITNSSIRLSGS